MEARANLPIGVFGDFKYDSEEYMLAPNSTLFLYTDGLTEAMNEKRKQFGLGRIHEQLTASIEAQHSGAQQLLEDMSRSVNQFTGNAEQSDDLTMLAIHYTPQASECTLSEEIVLHNDLGEVKALNEFVKTVVAQVAMEPALGKKLRLAVEEAVVNVMSYAYPTGVQGEITVKAASNDKRLKFIIIDSGTPFDPTETINADTSLSAEDRPIGGLGILLVRELMDSVNYERVDGKNILTLRKNI